MTSCRVVPGKIGFLVGLAMKFLPEVTTFKPVTSCLASLAMTLLQIIPDDLPAVSQLESIGIADVTVEFDGGSGHDSVYFLGGDLDSSRQPSSDQVTVRFNPTVDGGRYEFAAVPWTQ